MKRFPFTRRHRNLLLAGLLAAAAAAVFCLLAWAGIGIPCLFRRITGLLCPGCGNSRAALALLRLDLAAALEYNLLFPLEFAYLLWVAACSSRAYLKGKPFTYNPPAPALDIALLVIILLWGILRNILSI